MIDEALGRGSPSSTSRSSATSGSCTSTAVTARAPPPRRAGYLQTMGELGPRAHGAGGRGDFTERGGSRGAAERLLRSGDAARPPSSRANDLVAAGALGRLEAVRGAVPRDVSVVGFDNTFLAELHHIPLTTIHQPRREMGRHRARPAPRAPRRPHRAPRSRAADVARRPRQRRAALVRRAAAAVPLVLAAVAAAVVRGQGDDGAASADPGAAIVRVAVDRSPRPAEGAVGFRVAPDVVATVAHALRATRV